MNPAPTPPPSDTQQAIAETERLRKDVQTCLHAVRNEITAILGLSELALQAAREGKDLLQDLHAIVEAAEGLRDTERRLEARVARPAEPPSITDVNDLIAQFEGTFRSILGDGVRLHLEPAARHPFVRIPASEILRVFRGLATFAHDAMPTAGTYRVSTRNVPFGQGEALEVRFADTGAGIAPEELPHVFSETAPEGSTRRSIFPSLARRIVATAGGRAECASRAGYGTSFALTIPTCDAAPSPAAGTPPVALRGTESVLLLETDRSARLACKEMLSRHGYRVTEAASVAEAERAAKSLPRHSVSLFVSDMLVDDQEGTQIFAKLRLLQGAMRGLIVSSYNAEPMSSVSARNSDLPFVEKPFRMNTFLHHVRWAIDGTRPPGVSAPTESPAVRPRGPNADPR